MESDPARMCALLVGLPEVTIIGVGEWPKWLQIEIRSRVQRPLCWCGKPAHRHGTREVALVDLPCFGRATRLVWRKQRWRCPLQCCTDEPSTTYSPSCTESSPLH